MQIKIMENTLKHSMDILSFKAETLEILNENIKIF